MRKILSAHVKKQPLTDGCYQTFMMTAKCIVNNRPLVAIMDDLNDLEAILLLLRENETGF